MSKQMSNANENLFRDRKTFQSEMLNAYSKCRKKCYFSEYTCDTEMIPESTTLPASIASMGNPREGLHKFVIEFKFIVFTQDKI